jgi:hypothetical protein
MVTVGETTADDIFWWMREKALKLGLDTEFLPGVRIARQCFAASLRVVKKELNRLFDDGVFVFD